MPGALEAAAQRGERRVLRVPERDAHAVAASHAGVVGLVRALALEVAHKGITVNAILKASGETPIGREITATDVAQTLVYLLGPGASGVTGQALNVCGGATA